MTEKHQALHALHDAVMAHLCVDDGALSELQTLIMMTHAAMTEDGLSPDEAVAWAFPLVSGWTTTAAVNPNPAVSVVEG